MNMYNLLVLIPLDINFLVTRLIIIIVLMIYLTNKEASTLLCSVVKHERSVRENTRRS